MAITKPGGGAIGGGIIGGGIMPGSGNAAGGNVGIGAAGTIGPSLTTTPIRSGRAGASSKPLSCSCADLASSLRLKVTIAARVHAVRGPNRPQPQPKKGRVRKK